MSIRPGVRFGPYEILAPLGAGGMGEVYRARDSRLDRVVALKTLPASFARDHDRLRRFEQEARAVSALNHPNILTIHDVGQQDGVPFIVSELLEGETLRERLAGADLPVRKAVDYAVQIAHGLAAAHEKGIVHRDLKPENVFVTEDGRVKILDFGLSKLKPEPASLTMARTGAPETEPGVVMGTVGYMSPEQVRGQTADHRSDIFSFGAMLHEMLTGARAFRGSSAVETMNAILKDEPAEPRADLPPSLDRVVRRCLEKTPAERFQSARDLGFALGEAVSVPSTPHVAASAEAPDGRFRQGLWLAGGIAAVVLLAAVFVSNVGGMRDRLRSAPTTDRIQSLAVLPLTNFSRDPDQEYFADGMTEALITDLAQIGALRVISRTSVMMYKGVQKPLPQIGRELNVDAVLEGSVQRSGGRVLVTAQLIEAATDRHLWAKSYERDMKDVLSLQSEVAQAVASEIRAAVTPDEQGRLVKARPVDPKVHELYLQGRFHSNKGTEEETRKGIEYYEQALALAPSYALAWVGLSDAYISLSDYFRAPFEVLPKAKIAAQRAIALDDNLAGAHASLGNLHTLWDWDWAGAERELKRAIELNPNLADAHHYYALLLSSQARHDEAIAEAQRAQQLDPFSLIVNNDAGWVSFMARRLDRALAQFQQTAALEPRFGWAHEGIAMVHAAQGRRSEALAAAEKGPQVDDSPLVLAAAGGVYAKIGEQEKARRVISQLDQIAKRRYVCPYEVGVIYAGLGETDDAFRWLEQGFRDRSACMPNLTVDLRLDPLRSDARFDDLLHRMGFPADAISRSR